MNCKPAKSGDQWMAFCPLHEADGRGHKPSLALRQGDRQAVVLNCHAGCDSLAILKALGMNGAPRPSKDPVAVYAYKDETGRELRQKVRFEPKDFRIRHRDPATGEWVYKAGKGPCVLYRLPELKTAIAEGRTVFVVEGEKDADRLAALGLAATTNIEGAAQPNQRAKWRKDYTEQLRGAARVILLPDNDAPGRAHMAHVAQELAGKVADIRVLELPGLPDKGDVSDWLNAGHTVEELEALTKDAPQSETPPEELEPRKNKNANTLLDAVRALTEDWPGVIGFNDFRQRIEKRIAPPIPGIPAGPWRDVDTAETMLWLQREKGAVFGRDLVDLAVMIVANRHNFNPAQDRLRALSAQWDGKARLSVWLVDCLGAAATDGNREYLAEIGAAWLKGIAARVLLPGCKRDDVLVLRGQQGWKKSTAAQAIADSIMPESFTDSVDLKDIGEAKIQIRGVILAEFSELAGLARGEINSIKAVVSRPFDHFREKFGRHAGYFHRTVSFIGTTNDPSYLKDPTGDRRWWPVTLSGPVDVPALEAALPQLTGEAARRVLNGEAWHVTAEVALRQAEQVRAVHYDQDPWTDKVLQLADSMEARGDYITTAELLEALLIPRVQQNAATQRRIASILRASGYEEARRWLDKKANRSQRYWLKPYIREVVPCGYPVPARQEAAKVGNHMGTTSPVDPVPAADQEPPGTTSLVDPVPGFSEAGSGCNTG